MSLTICWVVYNEEKNLALIHKNMRSVVQAGWPLLVIDNGSTDGSSSSLREIAQKMGAQYIWRDFNHLPQARQQALCEVKTDWIVFIDADVEVDSDWIGKVFMASQNCTQDTVVLGGAWLSRGKAETLYRTLFTTFLGNFGLIYLQQTPSLLSPQFVSHLPTAAVALRREPVLSVGGFCSTMPFVGEDLDLSYRLGTQNYKLLFLPNLSVGHHLPRRLKEWQSKMWFYGFARGSLLWTYQDFGKLKNFLPFLFLTICGASLWHPFVFMAMAVFYFLICGLVSRGSFWVFVWLVSTHFFYSMGAVYGFLSQLLGQNQK